MNVDGVCMHVSATAEQGVVGSDTRLVFMQKGTRVLARYAGGKSHVDAWLGGCSGQSSSSDTRNARHPARYTRGAPAAR